MADSHNVRTSATGEWPALPLVDWKSTYETLHMYTQIIGKVRLGLSPMMNEWWQVALYLTARGLTTSPIAYGDRTFELEFDFVAHDLLARTSDGQVRTLPLGPRAVADFYADVMGMLRSLDIEVSINPLPSEVPSPIPFHEDRLHASYDAEYVHRFWDILRRLDVVLKGFRARFTGKSSPVHFFWGSCDLAVTRFSGRLAPPRPNANRITRIAYDEEVVSVGFWPGGTGFGPLLYAYAVPEPLGFAEQRILPAGALYSPALREFILDYDLVRNAEDPAQTVLDFAQSTYDAGATLLGWDRDALERPIEVAPARAA